ncbi:MAG TPA: CapA family protein [Desulfuromonadales bacterium]|nr:CapA family protein [Desulfuromonadales bacterium]
MGPFDTVDIFLAGDVMTGRGIDQILPHSGEPQLHEPWVQDSRTYVSLAEEANGAVPSPAAFDYIWGSALEELRQRRPDLRLINLETAVTVSDEWWRGKGIHYRMHPDNVPVLTCAGINVCSLANNHVLDWGRSGLQETLKTLDAAGIARSGAGKDSSEARAPAIADRPEGGRILVFSVGGPGCGIPDDWAAGDGVSGVHLLEDISETTASQLAKHLLAARRSGDIVILSVHWGGNWGYDIPDAWRRFAHRLIDMESVDLIHGHSSHHPKGLELYRDRLILYGCGDLINDYEGIGGHEVFRPELGLLYFAALDAGTGRLQTLEMVPTRLRNFRLNRTESEETQWLHHTLDRESRRQGNRIDLGENGILHLRKS